MRPTAGAAGRHPARHGGGKLRLKAEQVRRLFARSSEAPVFLLVARQCQKPNVPAPGGAGARRRSDVDWVENSEIAVINNLYRATHVQKIESAHTLET